MTTSLAQIRAELEFACCKLALTVETSAALGRTLAEPLTSSQALPAFAIAAMDGYAFNSGQTGLSRAVSPGTVLAGDLPEPLPLLCAQRIMTGARMPEGADCVVPLEVADLQAGMLLLSEPSPHAPRRTHVRVAGSVMAAGELVLPAGTRLGAQELGLAASLGITRLSVFERLRVAVLSTGNELGDDRDSSAFDANRPMLLARCAALGFEVIDLGLVRDEPRALQGAVNKAFAERADVLLSTGGVSEGDADLLATSLAAFNSDIARHQLALRPGKPFAHANLRRTAAAGEQNLLWLGLPGNPVAAFTVFELVAKPALRGLSGLRLAGPSLRCQLGVAVRKPPELTQALRVTLATSATGALEAWPLADQSSASLKSLAQAHGLVVLPQGQEHWLAGAYVELIVLE